MNVLIQAPVSINASDAPPVNDRFGALDDEPPLVLPILNLLDIFILHVNPPVPVHVKLVIAGILIARPVATE